MDYLLQLKIPIEAIDDLDARQKLNEIKKDWNKGLDNPNVNIKFQKVYKNKEPVKLEI